MTNSIDTIASDLSQFGIRGISSRKAIASKEKGEDASVTATAATKKKIRTSSNSPRGG